MLQAPPPGWRVASLGLPLDPRGIPVALDALFLSQLWQALHDQLSPSAVHLLGFSMGGKWALALRLLHPDPEATDFLLAPDGIWTHPIQRLTQRSVAGRALLRWALAHPEWVLRRAGQLHRYHLLRRSDLYFLRRHFSTPSHRQHLQQTALAYRHLHLSLGAVRAFAGKHAPDWHLIWGTQDQVLPPRAARRLQRLVPGLQLYWLEGVGHNLPGRAAAAVRQLLDEQLWGGKNGPHRPARL